ncbi:MAG: sporulation protein YqfD [Eubacterium sp.]|nr:sporulation protein YqfD [Eubacterium sp.]
MKKAKAKRSLGYVRFSCLGGFQEKLISKLVENNIQLFDIRQENGKLSALAYPRDYEFIARTAVKYKVRIRATERKGIYFFLRKYRKRWGIIFGAFSCLAIILILSQFVWDIRVSGNETVADTEILNVLQKEGLSPGAGKFSFDTRICELNTVNTISELSWVSVEREGSRVYVKVGESVQIEEPEIPVSTPCNIIADCDGQLISAIVHRGTLQTTVGSGVSKGQVLVSGTVNDNGGHIVYVHSDGEFIVRTEQTEEFYLPFKTVERVADGEQIRNSYFMIGGFSVPVPWESGTAPTDDYSYSEDTYNISFFGLDTPFKVRQGIYTQYTEREVTYTNRDITEQLERRRKDYEKNFLSDAEIVSSDKTFTPDENGIKLTVKYTLEKPFGKKQEISIIYG